MAIQVINIGTSANKGDGEPLRTAFDKINDNFSELSLKVTNLETGGVTVTTGDIKGSVFGDDSTLLVDGINSRIPSSVLHGALPAIDGSALTGITTTETDPVVGAITGIVKADGSGNISAAVAGTDYLTTVAFADLTATPTTIAGYGITDAYTKTEVDNSIASVTAGHFNFNITGDDSTVRTVTSGSTLQIKGGTGTTTASDVDGNITINGLEIGTSATTALAGNTALFSGAYNDLTGKPTLFSGAYGDLTGSPTNVSTFTNDSGYLTNVPPQTFVSLSDTPPNFTGQAGKFVKVNAGETALEFDTVSGSSYTDSDVDTHLNTGTAGAGEVLSWSGSDYDWVANAGGLSDVVSDTTPQLGGALDLNNNNITGNGSINISGGATVSGNLVAGTGTVGGLTFAGTQIASDDSTQISFQDNIEIAGGPVISGFNLSHTGTFTINPYGLNLNTTGGNIAINPNNNLTLDVTGSSKTISIGNSSTSGSAVSIGAEVNNTSVRMNGVTEFNARAIFSRGTHEIFYTFNGQGGVTDHNVMLGHLFYHTGVTSDLTPNFTNFDLTAEDATNITIIINQGNTAYEIPAIQIGGSAQTIVWQNNNAPTGTANGTDSFSFTILNDGGTYVVLGQMVSFGGV